MFQSYSLDRSILFLIFLHEDVSPYETTKNFLIEKIFNIEGMGLLGFTSLIERDYEVVMGILAISCILQMIGNLLSDICVAYVDPRVKFD